MSEFNLEKQYQKYLKLVNLSESNMHPIQKKETKRAFMGACGQMLVLLRDELALLDEDKAVQVLQEMNNEVSNYFLSETNQLN